jgi:hypothetical protein
VILLTGIYNTSILFTSSRDNRALCIAASEGYIEVIVELLKDYRVDPSDMDNLAIKAAIRNHHHDVVEELFQDQRVALSFET